MNPLLVYRAISGFGATGPDAPRGGHDLIAQEMGVPLRDLAAGLVGVYGILCALDHRERTGEGVIQ